MENLIEKIDHSKQILMKSLEFNMLKLRIPFAILVLIGITFYQDTIKLSIIIEK